MKQLKNDNGLTLIEILAVIVISSIVAVFITSILHSTTKQKIEQQIATEQLTNATFILKAITKDFRRSLEFEIDKTKNPNELIFTQPDKSVTYKMDNTQQIVKISSSGTEEVIAKNVGCFYVDYIGSKGNQTLTLKVSSNPAVTDCTIKSNDIKETRLQTRNGDI